LHEKQKISVVLSTAELDRFNSYCTDKGHKKSTLICRLIREHLDRESYHVPDQSGSGPVAGATTSGRGGRFRKKGG
jgi:hypothetical protein